MGNVKNYQLFLVFMMILLLSGCASSVVNSDQYFNKADFNDRQYKNDAKQCYKKAKASRNKKHFSDYTMAATFIFAGPLGLMSLANVENAKRDEASYLVIANCMVEKGYDIESVGKSEKDRRISMLDEANSTREIVRTQKETGGLNIRRSSKAKK